jgi:hypothetical protein
MKYDILIDELLRDNINPDLEEGIGTNIASGLLGLSLLANPASAQAKGAQSVHKPKSKVTMTSTPQDIKIDFSRLYQIYPGIDPKNPAKDALHSYTIEEAKQEVGIISKVAKQYSLTQEQTILLFTIRRIENGAKGGGMEFGVGDPGSAIRTKERQHPELREVESRLQAKWLEKGMLGDPDTDPKAKDPEIQALQKEYNNARAKLGLPKKHKGRRWEGHYLQSVELQAKYAAGTIKKHSGSLQSFGKGWCPVNPSWCNLASTWMNKIKSIV